MPRLGGFHLLAGTASANLILAATIVFVSAERTSWKAFAVAANIVLLAASAFIGFSNYFYDPAVASYNTVMYWNLYDRPLTLRENAHALDIVYFRDGLNANISVARTDDYVAIRTNGKVDASNRDATTQLLLGHLAALAHPPHRVALGVSQCGIASAANKVGSLEQVFGARKQAAREVVTHISPFERCLRPRELYRRACSSSATTTQ